MLYYDKVEFEQVVRTEGDSMARFKNRVYEILQKRRFCGQTENAVKNTQQNGKNIGLTEENNKDN